MDFICSGVSLALWTFISTLECEASNHTGLVYNYFIWSMIQRGSDTSFTNLWSLLIIITLYWECTRKQEKYNLII